MTGLTAETLPRGATSSRCLGHHDHWALPDLRVVPIFSQNTGQAEHAESSRGLGLGFPWDSGRVQVCASYLNDSSLLGVGAFQRLHDQPGALVVLDVGADLADHLRIAKRVQVVVLDLRTGACTSVSTRVPE